ncbi:MAG: hypothetical protein U1F27_15415 [Turneriella sp.]
MPVKPAYKYFLEEIMADGKRPTVATVFGVLNIVLSGLGLVFGILAVGVTLTLLSSMPIQAVVSLIGLLLSALGVFSGILLITNKKNALSITNMYVIGSIVVALIGVVNTVITVGMAGVFAGIVGLLISLIYPALVYFLVLKSEPVKSFYNSQG